MPMMYTWKSDSLKSYEMFQPILPYFLRSCTTAWKNASTNTSEGNASCGHSRSASAEILKYVLRMFSLRPFGGSVTTYKGKVKVCFYIAQYPVHCTAQNALHFTSGRPVHSGTNSTSLGSIQPCSNYAQRLFTHISTTVNSQVLIYTADWTEASWGKKNCPNFETVAKGRFEPGLT